MILQATLEVAVSADYVHIWKYFHGKDLGDGPVGFMGTAASVLLILDFCIKECRVGVS